MKQILLVAFTSILFFSCKPEPGAVLGTITYSSEASMDKPDSGAKIYLTQENTDTLSLFLETYNVQTQALLISSSEKFINEYQTLRDETNKDKIDERINLLNKRIEVAKQTIATYDKYATGVKPSELAKDSIAFKKIEERAYANLFNIQSNAKTRQTIANGNGVYSIEGVAPGKYSAIFVSSNSKELNLVESSGRVKVISIEIKSKETTKTEENFSSL